MTPLVVLVGPPGAGKTTVGELLADRRKVSFRDTDRDVEAATGRSVMDIFVDQGEPEFRRLESAAVETALRDHSGVLALGGGAVLDATTRSRLSKHHVVFLDVGLTDAAARIGLNRDRPLLMANPRSQLKRMLDERRPVYAEVASATVVTDGLTPDAVADAVASLL